MKEINLVVLAFPASSSSNTGALNQQLYNKLMYRRCAPVDRCESNFLLLSLIFHLFFISSKQRGTRENSVLIGAYATAKLKVTRSFQYL